MKLLLSLIGILFFMSCVEYEATDISTIRKICVEGHTYYYHFSGGIAPKLNDDGTPCKCMEK